MGLVRILRVCSPELIFAEDWGQLRPFRGRSGIVGGNSAPFLRAGPLSRYGHGHEEEGGQSQAAVENLIGTQKSHGCLGR